jgi:hypothetical protein
MPGETTHFKIKYASAADEVKKFPAEVSQPGAETADVAIYEGNKVANGQVYGALTPRTSGTEYEPSAARPTQVTVYAVAGEAGQPLAVQVEVGGVLIGEQALNGGSSKSRVFMMFICPAGKKWRPTLVGGGAGTTLESSYLPL